MLVLRLVGGSPINRWEVGPHKPVGYGSLAPKTGGSWGMYTPATSLTTCVKQSIAS